MTDDNPPRAAQAKTPAKPARQRKAKALTPHPPTEPKATASARPAPKRARGKATAKKTTSGRKTGPPAKESTAATKPLPGSGYSSADKARAIDLIDEHGIAHAFRVTGIAKTTLSRWAKAAGVDVGATARARTANAASIIEARVLEAKVTAVTRLEAILEAELTTHARIADLELTITGLLADARERVLAGERIVEADVGAFGVPYLVLTEPRSQLGQLLGLVELAGKVSKRDVVGAWTRAVHDLQLLRGEATERGDLVVRFGIPRPDAAASDAAAVDEADLGSALVPTGGTR